MDTDKKQPTPEENIKTKKKPSGKKSTAKRIGIVTFVIGVLCLAGGLGFLAYNSLKAPSIRDADYLVQVGTWNLQDDSAVVWQFTEIGKGKLTTNFYINEYDFIWAIEGDRLKIETDWLYTLNNEYVYELNQSENTLTLRSGDDTSVFVPLPIEGPVDNCSPDLMTNCAPDHTED